MSARPGPAAEREFIQPIFHSVISYNKVRALRLEVYSVAQADIDIADEKMLPRAVELYNAIFRPKREIDFFKRRFLGAITR